MTSSPLDLITGRGHYVDDHPPAGTLSAAFVRTDVAHAVVKLVDTSAAELVPGVVATHTAETLPLPDIPAQLGPTAPLAVGMDRPILARERVRYAGEAVALVLGDSATAAADGAQAVWPELDPLPPVINPMQAAEDQVLLFPQACSNVVVHREKGGDAGRLPKGPVVVDLEITHPRLADLAIEPLGVLAVPDERGGVEVWCGHQAPHRLHSLLGSLLGLEPGRLRVRVPDVGGAFGNKGPIYPEYVAVVAAALAHRRPVLWRERRREHFSGGTHGRGLRHRVRLVGDERGRLLGLHLRILGDLGAYPQTGFVVVNTAATIGAGPYRIDHVSVDLRAVVTNTAPTGPYRGAGRPEAALALERAIDMYARRVGIDPVEVRLRNLIDPSALPLVTATGARYDSGDYRRALQVAVRMADLPSLRKEQQRRREQGGDSLGVGVATFVEPAGGAVDSGEYGAVEVRRDGQVVARTGSTATGQRHAPTWRRIVAEVFDLAPDQVELISGDTREVPHGEGTFGSRSTQLGAVGLRRTAARVAGKAREVAASILEAAVEDVVVERGGFSVAGVLGSWVSLATVAEAAEECGVKLAEEEMYSPGVQTFPYGTHLAVVEVCRETGEVRLEQVVAVDDCGRVLDPVAVEGQLLGGLVQGMGQALWEEVRYREDGQLLTGSLLDYQPPRASDVPPVHLGHIETLAENELGVKGVGEAGTVGLPAAIVNAVVDALAPDGVTHLDLPLTPLRVWTALQAASALGAS